MERLGAVTRLEQERAALRGLGEWARRARASPAKISDGSRRSRSRTASSTAWSGHSGCCSAGNSRHEEGVHVGSSPAMGTSVVPSRFDARASKRLDHVRMRIFSGIQPTGDTTLGN